MESDALAVSSASNRCFLAGPRRCGTLRSGFDADREIVLAGYMELLIVLVFALGWLVIEWVAKRYDEPRRDDPPADSAGRDDP